MAQQITPNHPTASSNHQLLIQSFFGAPIVSYTLNFKKINCDPSPTIAIQPWAALSNIPKKKKEKKNYIF